MYGCGRVETLDLSNLDTFKVTNMSNIFHHSSTSHGEVSKAVISSNWNPAMTESDTGYSGKFEVNNY